MASRALPEDQLHRFLRRRRRRGASPEDPLGPFLAETLDLAARLIPSQAGSLLLDDPTIPRSRSPLTFVAAFGPAAVSLVGATVPRGRGIVGHVYETGELYATGRPTDDPHFFEKVDAAAGFRTRCLVAAPIRLERHICGVFELVNRRGRGNFSARDIEVVTLLGGYISRAILNSVDVLKQSELARKDELTGLGNVRGLHPDLEGAVRSARKDHTDLAVLFIDVDHLKALNDRHGHRAGSEALRRIGVILGRAAGPSGLAYRFGGDEFVVVLRNHDPKAALEAADEIRGSVAAGVQGPMRHGGALPKLTVSVGVATLETALTAGRATAAQRAARLLAAADHALYRAKRQGRDRSAKATRRDDRLR